MKTNNSLRVRASRFFSDRYAYRERPDYLVELVAFGFHRARSGVGRERMSNLLFTELPLTDANCKWDAEGLQGRRWRFVVDLL
jgi:hypothetical protein